MIQRYFDEDLSYEKALSLLFTLLEKYPEESEAIEKEFFDLLPYITKRELEDNGGFMC